MEHVVGVHRVREDEFFIRVCSRSPGARCSGRRGNPGRERFAKSFLHDFVLLPVVVVSNISPEVPSPGAQIFT